MLIVDDNKNGIITLFMQQKQAERMIYKRSYSTNNPNHSGHRGPGRPPNTEIPLEELFPQEDDVIFSMKYFFFLCNNIY